MWLYTQIYYTKKYKNISGQSLLSEQRTNQRKNNENYNTESFWKLVLSRTAEAMAFQYFHVYMKHHLMQNMSTFEDPLEILAHA
jgi:hypothetical protein